jgi:UDP-galactopyranose mutase
MIDYLIVGAGLVVNYPNEQLFTRITEFKYLTGQEHSRTSIVYEFPRAQGDAYYPVPRKENAELYAKYKALADATPKVHFVGRLATYKYHNMDQIVAQALTTYPKMISAKRAQALVMSAGHAGNGYGNDQPLNDAVLRPELTLAGERRSVHGERRAV